MKIFQELDVPISDVIALYPVEVSGDLHRPLTPTSKKAHQPRDVSSDAEELPKTGEELESTLGEKSINDVEFILFFRCMY